MSELRATRATLPKRFYSQREVSEFSADGTPWTKMFKAALSNVERGNFNGVVRQDVRRMGELAGRSNKSIGHRIARALARSRKAARG